MKKNKIGGSKMKRITLAFLMFIAVALPGLYTTHETTLAQQFTLQCVSKGNIPLECPEGVDFPTCCINDVPGDCIGEEIQSDFGEACNECGGRVAVTPAAGSGATCSCSVAGACGY